MKIIKQLFVGLSLFVGTFQLVHAQNFEIYSEIQKEDNQIVASIKAKNFKDIVGWQFTINWDATELDFQEVRDYNLIYLDSSRFNMAFTEMGEMPMLWYDTLVQGITISDDSTLFNIVFESNTEKHKNLFFDGTPVPIEIVAINENNDLLIIPVIFNNTTPPADTGLVNTPAYPTDIITSVNAKGRFQISWESTEEAIAYNVQVRKKSTNDWQSQQQFRKNSLYVYAPIDKSYEYRLQTIFKDDTSEFSPIYSLPASSLAERILSLRNP